MFEFDTTSWIWLLGFGLSVVTIALVALRGDARRSIWWRLILCFLLAIVIAPTTISWNNGHNAGGVIIFPAIFFLFGYGLLPGLVAGGVPVCATAALLLGIWSFA